MSPEVGQEVEKEKFSWSILNGKFAENDLIDYEKELKSIEKDVYENWEGKPAANRILVDGVLELAVAACQPGLFLDPNEDNVKVVRRDIGSSVYASYGYSEEQRDKVSALASEHQTREIPVWKALETILINSPIFLSDGKDLAAICRTAILHVILKQQNMESKLPKAVYND